RRRGGPGKGTGRSRGDGAAAGGDGVRAPRRGAPPPASLCRGDWRRTEGGALRSHNFQRLAEGSTVIKRRRRPWDTGAPGGGYKPFFWTAVRANLGCKHSGFSRTDMFKLEKMGPELSAGRGGLRQGEAWMGRAREDVSALLGGPGAQNHSFTLLE